MVPIPPAKALAGLLWMPEAAATTFLCLSLAWSLRYLLSQFNFLLFGCWRQREIRSGYSIPGPGGQ